MDGRQRQKRRAHFELNKDFLSSMPSEIIENILVRLPIKEAVRTSVLSSKWKSSWASMPDLVFPEKCVPESQLIESVDKVLQAHRGTILKFELDGGLLASDEAINRWLLVLSKNGLKDLRLKFDLHSGFMVPSSLFSCDKLENLRITDSTIYAPQCFQGLKLLRHLQLFNCKLVGITIEKIVSGCPLLERLTLLDFVEHGCLAIRAPNLKVLNLLGEFGNLLLETPKLISASLSGTYRPNYQDLGPGNDGSESKLLHIIGPLSNIEDLHLDSSFCKYLASGPIPEKLPVTFHHLETIGIILDGRGKDVDVALCIFNNAPNLKTLYIGLPSQNIWEERRMTTISFLKQLEEVVVLDVEDLMHLLPFAKLILSTTPLLKQLVIEGDIHDFPDGMEFLMKLESLPRLSSKPVICFGWL